MMLLRNLSAIKSHFRQSAVIGQFYRQSSYDYKYAIGCREIVGPGRNNEITYVDMALFPFPAVRFRESTPEIHALREKERGDWRKLTKEEKKCLYRYSFCQTFPEMNANSGEWKSILGIGLIGISVGIWLTLFLKWCWSTELPETYDDARQQAQLKRILALEMNPVDGIASKWDYKKECWKK